MAVCIWIATGHATIAPEARDSKIQMFSGPDKEESLNMFAKMAADALAMRLTKITVRGNIADLEFKSTTDDSSSTRLRTGLSGVEWKIGD